MPHTPTGNSVPMNFKASQSGTLCCPKAEQRGVCSHCMKPVRLNRGDLSPSSHFPAQKSCLPGIKHQIDKVAHLALNNQTDSKAGRNQPLFLFFFFFIKVRQSRYRLRKWVVIAWNKVLFSALPSLSLSLFFFLAFLPARLAHKQHKCWAFLVVTKQINCWTKAWQDSLRRDSQIPEPKKMQAFPAHS